MTVLETTLVFGAIPVVVMALVTVLVYGASARRVPKYRPGRSYEFAPVWFLAAERSEVTPPALAPGTRKALPGAPQPARPAGTRKGGARGTW